MTEAIRPDSVLTGTVDRPALTSEGDTVLSVLSAGSSVRATVVGPEVPGEGLPHQAPTAVCTWTVTLVGGHTSVPLRLNTFTTLDDQGTVYPLTLVPGHPRPPAVLRAGRRASFLVRARMRTGEGVLRWAPQGQILAMWDFTVETD